MTSKSAPRGRSGSSNDSEELLLHKTMTRIRGPIAVAAAMLTLAIGIGFSLHLPLLPFILCALVFTLATTYITTMPSSRADNGGRLVLVFLLLIAFGVLSGATGGLRSPYIGALYLPVFLGALYFGLPGAMIAGLIGALALAGFGIAIRGSGGPVPLNTTATQTLVYLLVAVGAGAFAERLYETASAASRRARVQANRAWQAEWLIDTTVMMQSLIDLEYMLSIALMRLGDLVQSDVSAIFLRDPEDFDLALAQSTGIEAERIGVHRLAASALNLSRESPDTMVYLPETKADDGRLGAFRGFDPEARSVVVVPLRTLEDFFGALYVSRRGGTPLSDEDRSQLVEFARHIVYPIQRVRLQLLATTDALTGLHNVRAFRRRLRDEIERASRYRLTLSLILLDIDHFKRINDTLGHRAGDAILSQLGTLLRRTVRGIDFAARYGGEEMAILCPETNPDDGQALAERIRRLVEETTFELPDGGAVKITVSLGVSSLSATTKSDNELIEQADQGLYRAKSDGRNRVRTIVTTTPVSVPKPPRVVRS